MTWLLAISLIVLGAVMVHRGRSRNSLLFAAFVLIAGVEITLLMGVPRPAWTSSLQPDDLIIGADYQPGKAIYVWVHGYPPIAFSLPWSEELAKELQDGLRTAQDTGLPGINMRQTEEGYSVMEGEDTLPARSEPKQ